jgi:hypothetical protein
MHISVTVILPPRITLALPKRLAAALGQAGRQLLDDVNSRAKLSDRSAILCRLSQVPQAGQA